MGLKVFPPHLHGIICKQMNSCKACIKFKLDVQLDCNLNFQEKLCRHGGDIRCQGLLFQKIITSEQQKPFLFIVP